MFKQHSCKSETNLIFPNNLFVDKIIFDTYLLSLEYHYEIMKETLENLLLEKNQLSIEK